MAKSVQLPQYFLKENIGGKNHTIEIIQTKHSNRIGTDSIGVAQERHIKCLNKTAH